MMIAVQYDIIYLRMKPSLHKT